MENNVSMTPRIELLTPRKLVGKSMRMSYSNDLTHNLWRSFMPLRKEIKNVVGSDLYSMQVYDQLLDAKDFDPTMEFTKWATIEVNDFSLIPNGMETYELRGGLYAVFLHKGPASAFQQTFQCIFGQWLPNSEYELDHRPHFEVLGEKYKNNDPESEEEVWIPIKPKQD